MNRMKFSDIFPDIMVNPEGWECYELPTSLDYSLQQFEHDIFYNTKTNVALVKNTSTGQYILFIREIGVYNLIFKAKLKMGYALWNEWRNCLYFADDRSVWNDHFLPENKTPYSFNVIRSNEVLLRLILADLYELLFGTLYKDVLNRIDELLLELHNINETNMAAAQALQKFIGPIEEGGVCPVEIQLGEGDTKKD